MRSFGLIEEPLGDKEHQRSEYFLDGSSHSHLDMETSLNMEVAPWMFFLLLNSKVKNTSTYSHTVSV